MWLLRARWIFVYFYNERYGQPGYDLINITYEGDTLIATKVTGNSNVPEGQITFTAELAPKVITTSSNSTSLLPEVGRLPPIQLPEKTADIWEKKKLLRFPGEGQIAGEGFDESEWVMGQLVFIGESQFSYVWVPLQFSVFFSRPPKFLWEKMFRDEYGDLPCYADSTIEQVADTIKRKRDEQAKQTTVKVADI